MRAFKCDRCGTLFEKKCDSRQYFVFASGGKMIDLCNRCYDEFVLFTDDSYIISECERNRNIVDILKSRNADLYNDRIIANNVAKSFVLRETRKKE